MKELHCQFFDVRPEGTSIDTLIIHTICNPDHEDCYTAESCLEILNKYEVSSHYFIDREGELFRFLPEESRARHAGLSFMPREEDGRARVNDFSIGIELAGGEGIEVNTAQMQSLAELVADLTERYPIENIYGHKHIAPDRKTDPIGFNWREFRTRLLQYTKDDTFNWPSEAFEEPA